MKEYTSNIKQDSTLELKTKSGSPFKIRLSQMFGLTMPYKTYLVTMDQYGTDHPIVTEFFNNTGLTITWARNDVGTYVATLDKQIDPYKTQVFVGPTNSGLNFITAGVDFGGGNILINTYSSVPAAADDILYITAFELRIFE